LKIADEDSSKTASQFPLKRDFLAPGSFSIHPRRILVLV